MAVKKCITCDVVKPLSEYRKQGGKRTDLKTRCKACEAIIRRKYYQENKEKIAKKDRTYYQENKNLYSAMNRKRRYGISAQEFSLKYKEQNGCCAVCGTAIKEYGPRSVGSNVDHCHSSGKIRALLCSPCNIGLGAFKDNISTLKSAIKYIASWRS